MGVWGERTQWQVQSEMRKSQVHLVGLTVPKRTDFSARLTSEQPTSNPFGEEEPEECQLSCREAFRRQLAEEVAWIQPGVRGCLACSSGKHLSKRPRTSRALPIPLPPGWLRSPGRPADPCSDGGLLGGWVGCARPEEGSTPSSSQSLPCSQRPLMGQGCRGGGVGLVAEGPRKDGLGSPFPGRSIAQACG